MQTEEFDEVLTHARLALELNPQSIKAHFRRAMAYYHQDEFDLADAAFQTAYKMDQTNQEVIKGMHLLKKKRSDYHEKNKKIAQAIAKNSGGHSHESSPTASSSESKNVECCPKKHENNNKNIAQTSSVTIEELPQNEPDEKNKNKLEIPKPESMKIPDIPIENEKFFLGKTILFSTPDVSKIKQIKSENFTKNNINKKAGVPKVLLIAAGFFTMLTAGLGGYIFIIIFVLFRTTFDIFGFWTCAGGGATFVGMATAVFGDGLRDFLVLFVIVGQHSTFLDSELVQAVGLLSWEWPPLFLAMACAIFLFFSW